MPGMDEDFAGFLEHFGPPIQPRAVPPSSIERYRGKLPDQLLNDWSEQGWCGYADGLFWIVNPRECKAVMVSAFRSSIKVHKIANVPDWNPTGLAA